MTHKNEFQFVTSTVDNVISNLQTCIEKVRAQNGGHELGEHTITLIVEKGDQTRERVVVFSPVMHLGNEPLTEERAHELQMAIESRLRETLSNLGWDERSARDELVRREMPEEPAVLNDDEPPDALAVPLFEVMTWLYRAGGWPTFAEIFAKLSPLHGWSEHFLRDQLGGLQELRFVELEEVKADTPFHAYRLTTEGLRWIQNATRGK